MESIVDSLTAGLLDKLKNCPPQERILVGLCGVPGSGKSQLARQVVDKVNAVALHHNSLEDVAALISIDGWHLTRAQLNAMPNSQEAKDRRGVVWTFDGKVSPP